MRTTGTARHKGGGAEKNMIWDDVEAMRKFAEQKFEENPTADDEWFNFDDRTDVQICTVGPSREKHAFAFPVDENGNTITETAYIQLF